MIIDDIRAAKIGVEKCSDNHYLMKLKRPKACPTCKRSIVSKGLRSRSVHDLDSEGRPIQVCISYPRYYCLKCKTFVNAESFDVVMPKSKYTDAFKNTLLRKILADPTKPHTQIYKEFGISKSTVEEWLEEANTEQYHKLCRFEPTENLIISPFTYGSRDCLLLMSVNGSRYRTLAIVDNDSSVDGVIYHFLDLITRIWPMPHAILVGDYNLIPVVENAIKGIGIHRAVANRPLKETISMDEIAAYANVDAPVILSKQALYNMAYACLWEFNQTEHWHNKVQMDEYAQTAAQAINECRDEDPYKVLKKLTECTSRITDVMWQAYRELYEQIKFWIDYLRPHDIDEDKCQTIMDGLEKMHSRGISFNRAEYITLMHDDISKIV